MSKISGGGCGEFILAMGVTFLIGIFGRDDFGSYNTTGKVLALVLVMLLVLMTFRATRD